MPAKKTKIKIVEGSCNTCKYRVSVPKDPTSRDLDAVRKPSCCFHRKLDFKTNKPQSECAFYINIGKKDSIPLGWNMNCL